MEKVPGGATRPIGPALPRHAGQKFFVHRFAGFECCARTRANARDRRGSRARRFEGGCERLFGGRWRNVQRRAIRPRLRKKCCAVRRVSMRRGPASAPLDDVQLHAPQHAHRRTSARPSRLRIRIFQGGVVLSNTPLVAIPLSFPVVLDNWLLQATLTVPITDYFLRINQNYTATTRAREAARYDARSEDEIGRRRKGCILQLVARQGRAGRREARARRSEDALGRYEEPRASR